MNTEFEPVIGLEVHCQLATDSKIFCSCKARPKEGASVAEEEVNANTCPVCSGHPGTLPVLNKKAVEYAIRAGLATNCEINPRSVFARKNYFYPDLPKGYQISQFDQPLCKNGYINIDLSGGVTKKIRLERIHMEEDAGKNIHMSGFSLVNLNRACVPLIEIVSAPDMRNSDEAGEYLRSLYAIVTYLGICDGNLQEGNFRCDANVSVRPKGAEKFGTKVEIKNVNSFRFIEKAIEYEISRQIEVIKSGGKIAHETRSYDSAKNVTTSMRSKEEAHDYRYFPEPDLVPLRVDETWVRKVAESLPELPRQKRERLIATLDLSAYDAGVLTASKSLSDFFQSVLTQLEKGGAEPKQVAKTVANLLTGEVSRLLNEAAIDISQSKLKDHHVADLVTLLSQNALSSTNAKRVITVAWESGESVDKIVEKEGLKQVSDLSALEPAVDAMIAKFPGQVAEYKSGKDKLLGFFVGQLMKETKGKGNPQILQDLVKKKLNS